MSEEFGPNFITLTDEDGNDIELEYVDALELDGQTYMAFFPVVEDDADEEAAEEYGLVILKSVVENGEEVAAAVSINYGTLLSTILDFIILAFAVFCMVKFLNNLHRKKEEAPAEEPAPEVVVSDHEPVAEDADFAE